MSKCNNNASDICIILGVHNISENVHNLKIYHYNKDGNWLCCDSIMNISILMLNIKEFGRRVKEENLNWILFSVDSMLSGGQWHVVQKKYCLTECTDVIASMFIESLVYK